MKVYSFILMFLFIGSTISIEKFEIIQPRDKTLLGAGHFDFKWTSLSNAKNYQIYVNDQLVDTITATIYDYYTTKVQQFTAYIQVELTNGEKRKTKTITFYITKKGLAVNTEMGKNLNPLAMNMGWYYTWSPTSPFAYTNTNYKYLEFVPMIWGTADEDKHLETVKSGNFMYLLGYNEPDFEHQSNIPYETAAQNWPKFQGKSRYLGSPVPAFSPTWDNGPWLNNFMSAVDPSTVDIIALHCYYGNYGGEAAAKTFLEDVVDGTYKKFGKPIWITEFAVSGWGYSDVEKRKEVDDFMRGCIKGLNEREYVERYSWFSFNTNDEANGASAMWTESTGQLTTLGETYVSYGNPEGYDYSMNPSPEIEITSSVRENVPYDDSIEVKEKTYENILRKNDVKASASSSVENSSPNYAIDNSIETRWESTWSDPQSLTIDLGSVYYIKQVNLMWQYSSACDYSIDVSNDGESFSTVASAFALGLNERRSETFLFGKMFNCRYIRINCMKRTTEWGYSIWEMAVYGSDVPDESDNPDPTDDIIIPDGKDNDNDNNGNSGKEKSKLSSGAIAAIVIVVILVVAAAIIVTIMLIRRRNMDLNSNSSLIHKSFN